MTDPAHALSELNLAYWDLVDGRRSIALSEIFHDNAVLRIGRVVTVGLVEIQALIDARRQASPDRLTRHVSTNWRCGLDGDAAGSASSIVLVFAGVGDVPLAMNQTSSLSDVRDRYVLTPQGWRLAERGIDPIFLSPEAPSFLRASD